MPTFDNDIFISYTHIDNQPLTEVSQKGWIDQFHFALETRLNQLIGEKSRVWRDKKLRGNDEFDETITKQFPKTALLVSILSPRYLKSDWCLKELNEFFDAAEHSGGLRVQGKSRVFKVIKTHVPLEEHPAELKGLLGYPFYEIEHGTDRPREFVIDPHDYETFKKFRLKLDDLAYEILDLLQVLRKNSSSPPGSTPSASGEAIYLADTTSDLTELRNQIKRDLRQRGYSILPDKPLPLNLRDLKNAMRENLAASKLSVHLIGGAYGIVPEGAEHSIVRLQVELTATSAKDRPFHGCCGCRRA
jgi:hypothetical protein